MINIREDCCVYSILMTLDYTHPKVHIEYEAQVESYPIKNIIDYGLFNVFKF